MSERVTGHIREINEAIKRNSDSGFESLYLALCNLANNKTDAREANNIFTLVKVTCPKYDQVDRVYKPWNPNFDRNVYGIEDLSNDELNYLEAIAEEIEGGILRARIFDFLWLLRRDYKNCINAIEEYSKIPISKETYFHSAKSCLERLLHLSNILYAKEREKREQIYDNIINYIISDFESEPVFHLQLIDLLASISTQYRHAEIIVVLKKLIEYFHANNKYFYLEQSVKSYFMWNAKNNLASPEVQMLYADMMGIVGDNTNAIFKDEYYYDAIKHLKMISNNEKIKYGIQSKISILESKIVANRPCHAASTQCVSTGSIKIQIPYEKISKRFSSLNLVQTIISFGEIIAPYDIEKAIKSARETIKKAPVFHYMPKVHYSDDGRVIHKSSGVNPSSEELTLDDLSEIIIPEFLLAIDLSTFAVILPSLNHIHQKHYFDSSIFIEVARSNPFINPCNAFAVAKGLQSGFNFDFVTSLHILSFQLEAFIRNVMIYKGVFTTAIDKSGIEDEKISSKFICKKEFISVFGNDLSFEINALFYHHLGLNIRNNLAHGLSDLSEYTAPRYVYAWYLIFRLFVSFYKQRQP